VRSVVVTGASTGIGRGCVKVLVAEGCQVFGAVRKAEDAKRLSTEFGHLFRPLLFDVTDREAVIAAAAEVEAILGSDALAGLVNNAGIAVPGPLLYLKVEDFARQLAVNLTGQLMVTQAFAPLLGAGRPRAGSPGRIVMISSVGGRNAAPFLGAYCASKFGLEGMSESLRRELLIFGVKVIIVAAGTVATPIWDKADGADARFAETPFGPAVQKLSRYLAVHRRQGVAAGTDRRSCEDGAVFGQSEDTIHCCASAHPECDDERLAEAHRGQTDRAPAWPPSLRPARGHAGADRCGASEDPPTTS
jgi:NAD(P)-dependent dehydrogenase (short-subunit alcohol dehydrogenase family)